jgi:molecular chaperone HscB
MEDRPSKEGKNVIELQRQNAGQATEAGGQRCWACNTEMPADTHFCSACGKVQPATATDHFRFFGLPRKLDIDAAGLEKGFYQLSRKLHPDMYARQDGNEQLWSLEKSAQLNDAYRTLKEPIARTQYLLELEGFKLEEQSSSATQAARESGREKKQVVPPELLEEVFELNMQLQELRMSKEMGETDAEAANALNLAQTTLQAKLSALDNELRSIWNHWDAVYDRPADDEPRCKILQTMLSLLNRRSYIRNLVRDVNTALEA